MDDSSRESRDGKQGGVGAGPMVLVVSGYSGSGKTTLIEKLVGELQKNGLRLAVVKHHHEPVSIDKPGSDTDRFFRAGAGVVSCDGRSVFVRETHSGQVSVGDAVGRLGPGYDLVLVEGFKSSEEAKIWLLKADETAAPGAVSNVLAVLGWDEDRVGKALSIVRERLGK